MTINKGVNHYWWGSWWIIAQGLTLEQARNTLLEDVNYFGTCMVSEGVADGMVSGAVHTTANTVRPALQIIKVQIRLTNWCVTCKLSKENHSVLDMHTTLYQHSLLLIIFKLTHAFLWIRHCPACLWCLASSSCACLVESLSMVIAQSIRIHQVRNWQP